MSTTPSNVHVSSHPLIAHKLTLLRNQTTKCDEFRRILREITFYLGYEVYKYLLLSSSSFFIILIIITLLLII